jgi:hypothetical protein
LKISISLWTRFKRIRSIDREHNTETVPVGGSAKADVCEADCSPDAFGANATTATT